MASKQYDFISYQGISVNENEQESMSSSHLEFMRKRRSVRDFSSKKVSKRVIENIITTASSAPSGANMQPWTFCAISSDIIKKEIRIAAEEEERLNYKERMSDEWLEDLAPLGTDEHKPFLEIAPWLIVIFKKSYELEGEQKKKHYYVNESVGLAAGFLIQAIHQAGLVTLTHTPSPMNFLSKILKRPSNERPFLLLPVGYPAEDAKVPKIEKKPLNEVSVWYE